MILSYADTDTKQLFTTERNRRFAAIARPALRKLIQLNNAGVLQDMAVPPGNRLEALRGNLGASTRSASMTSGESFSNGRKRARKKSPSWTITEKPD